MTSSLAIPRSAWIRAAGIGVAAGAVYSVSPTTLAFLLVLPGLLWWAQQRLSPRERVWVLGLLTVAVLARLIALAVFFLSANHTGQPYAVLIGDERFIERRSLWTLSMSLGYSLYPGDYYGAFATYGAPGVLQYVLAFWQLWFGQAPYGAHLFGVAMWLAGAVALYRTARRAFGPLPALGGFALLLFMPTLFVWSISALKEPPYFFLTAMTLVAVIAVVRDRRLTVRVEAALCCVGAVLAIRTLRSTALAATAGGLGVAAVIWLLTRRGWVAAVTVGLAIVAIVVAVRQPAVVHRLDEEFRLAAIAHIGNAITPGSGYRLLDSHFYSDAVVPYLRPDEAERFVVRAVASFLLVPLPWQADSRGLLAFVPQQLAWYVLAALAWVGVIAGWRRDPVFTSLLVGFSLVGALTVALYNGNVGTLVRMRDSIVPVIAWLSVVGACAALERVVSPSQKSVHGNP